MKSNSVIHTCKASLAFGLVAIRIMWLKFKESLLSVIEASEQDEQYPAFRAVV